MSSFVNDQPQKGTYPPLLPALSASRDRLFNHHTFTILGGNDAITGTEAVTPLGGATVTFPNSAQTFAISSSSLLDTDSAGDGARKILVRGLDANREPITETVSLNGTTPVNTTNLFLRINNSIVIEAGSGETNQGLISFVATDPVGTLFVIPVGLGQSNFPVFSVPSGATVYVYTFDWAIGNKQAGQMDMSVVVTNNRGVTPVTQTFKFTSSNSQGTSYNSSSFPFPIDFQEKSDFWFKATADSVDMEAVILVTGVLVDNENRQLPTSTYF